MNMEEIEKSKKEVDIQKIKFFMIELEKIERYFSDFTNRNGVLLTIAGLLSFLPPLGPVNSEHLPYFLLWTFPLLIIAIVAYFPASRRIHPIIKGMPFASKGSGLELEILENQIKYFDLVWRKTVEIYDSVLFWNGLMQSFIYAYIFSMVSNFYIFTFYGKPSLCISIILFIVSCQIIISLLIWRKSKSEKNKIIGDSTQVPSK